MLVVIPCGGLGNRLMALISAKIFAEHIGCAFKVSWQPEPHLPYTNCPIAALFEEFESIPLPENSFPGGTHYHHHVAGPVPEIEERLKAGGTVYLHSFCFIRSQEMDSGEFTDCLYRQFNALKPPPDLLARVPELHSGTIGIQIRRGDNWHSTKYSPLSLFFRVMDGHCENGGETRFFLATDSPRVNRLVEKRYGNRVQSLEKQTRYDEEGADTRRALVQILALSRTSRIYHSYMSSFSYISHLISRQPHLCVSVPNVPKGWYDSPADNMHARLIEWNHEKEIWQRRNLANISLADRLRMERIFYQTVFVCSKIFQLWPCHRLNRIDGSLP